MDKELQKARRTSVFKNEHIKHPKNPIKFITHEVSHPDLNDRKHVRSLTKRFTLKVVLVFKQPIFRKAG